MSDKIKQITFRLPEKLHQAFKVMSVQRGEGMGQVFERLISKYVEGKKEKPVKEKSKATASTIILNIIKQKKDVDLAEIRKQTGFPAEKVGDYICRLKKKGVIEKTSAGVFILKK